MTQPFGSGARYRLDAPIIAPAFSPHTLHILHAYVMNHPVRTGPVTSALHVREIVCYRRVFGQCPRTAAARFEVSWRWAAAAGQSFESCACARPRWPDAAPGRRT